MCKKISKKHMMQSCINYTLPKGISTGMHVVGIVFLLKCGPCQCRLGTVDKHLNGILKLMLVGIGVGR